MTDRFLDWLDRHYLRASLAIIAIFALTIGAALWQAVHAATGDLTWSLPTKYTDGSNLPAAEIAGFDGQCSGFTPTGGTRGACTFTPLSVTGTATSGALTVTIPAAGGSACFQIRTRATNGATSAWTPEVCKTFPPLVPNPPGNVTVAVVLGYTQAPVYSVTSTGKISTYVGAIDLGKSCGDTALFTYRSRTFYEVKRADVYLWGSTSLRLAAPCKGA